MNLLDLEPEAQKILPPGGFGYISGGFGANWTRRENIEAFSRVQIEPQALERRREGRSGDRVLGSKLSMPVFIRRWAAMAAPTSRRRPRPRRARPRSARSMTTSTVSNLSLEEIASHNPGPKWFQLYVPTDRG